MSGEAAPAVDGRRPGVHNVMAAGKMGAPR